jgi:hypothetical protein
MNQEIPDNRDYIAIAIVSALGALVALSFLS